jgi:hypothetical protein
LSSTQSYLDQLWDENPTGDDDGSTNASETTDGPSPVGIDPVLGRTIAQLRANERRVSRTDPDSAIVVKDLYGLFLAHKVHIAVDGGAARVVTAVVTTPGDGAECHQVAALLGQHTWQVRRRPGEVVADKAYGTRDVYRFLRNCGVKPTVPGPKPWKTKRARKLATGFRHDAQADIDVCPEGKKLYRVSQKTDGSVLYKAHSPACQRCPKRATICGAGRPSLTRHGKDDVLAWAENHLATPGARRSPRRRMSIIEPVFAEMKGPRGLGRANLRRNWKVHTQALLAMAAHNLRQLARAMRSLKEPANRAVGATPCPGPFGVDGSQLLTWLGQRIRDGFGNRLLTGKLTGALESLLPNPPDQRP